MLTLSEKKGILTTMTITFSMLMMIKNTTMKIEKDEMN